MRQNHNTVMTNDLNGSHPSRVGLASGRVGSKVGSVVIRRNPYNPYNQHAKFFPSKKLFRAGTWNIRMLLEIDAATILVVELEKAKINMMALQEVCWSGIGETTCGSYTILWSYPTVSTPGLQV